MHGIPIGFHHISLEHNEEIFMRLTSEIWFFHAQNSKDCHTSLGISSIEAVLSGHVQRFLIHTLKSIFYYVLELSFGNSAFEMLSIFPYVSRDDIFICDILLGRKTYIDVMTKVRILCFNWALIACHTVEEISLFKTPQSWAHDFSAAGLNTNSGREHQFWPTKLWLTSTIAEEIAQPLTLKICFHCHEWL